MPKHKSEDCKISTVKYYLKIKNQTKTCEVFDCSERSLMRWLEKYKETSQIKRKSRTYVSYKVKQIHVNYMKKIINKNKTITMKDLLQKLKNKYKDVDYTEMQVYRVIKDNNITLKQTKLRHVPKTRFRKPIDVKKQLKQFYKEVKKHKLENIICIDETSLNAYETRKHCYEKIGKRCTVKTDNQEVFKKYTGIFAISTKGVIGYEIYDKGGIDSDRLIEFINKFVNGKHKKKLIIMDNASSHRNKKVKEVITKNNYLLYSIPYQHFTNSIENWFSVLKSRLRKIHDIGLNNLKKNIKKLIKNIPKSTYKNILNGSYGKERKYKKGKTREKPLKNYL